jgi:hypothetical protein
MTDPKARQQAIDAMTQVIQGAAGDISEKDARAAAAMAVDRAIKERSSSDG